MIKPHQFIGLAVLTAVSVVAALGVYANANRWSAGKVEGAALAPDLARSINSVGAIAITQGDKSLTIERAGQGWNVRDRGGYPAKPEAARSLIVAFAQSQLAEPKTALVDKLGLLELEDPAVKDAKSHRVRVLDASGKPLTDVVVGKTRYDAFGSGKGGMYVRRTAETQSWLATGDPKISANITDWVDTRVFATDTKTAVKVTIENPGEAALVIEKAPPAAKDPKDDAKPADGPPKPPAKVEKFRVANMPDGHKLKQGVAIDSIVDAFGSIDLIDVRKLDGVPAGDNVQVVKLETDGGLGVTFRLRKDGDSSWISVAAESSATDEAVKLAADEINRKAKGWEYKIQNWKAEQIGKRKADLFETS
jgi:hypothetical protein